MAIIRDPGSCDGGSTPPGTIYLFDSSSLFLSHNIFICYINFYIFSTKKHIKKK